MVRAALCALLGVAAVGCTPTVHGMARYHEDPGAAAQVEARAAQRCQARRGEHVPPRAFRTDGCSNWPDARWVDCCVAHDMAYWCGGTAEARREADRVFRECVGETSGFWSGPMWLGVRTFGGSWAPLPSRWGFGWPYCGDPD